jgi:hypothetical protein
MSLINGLDTHTMKKDGENGHTEYGYSNNVDEQIVQFFFQLVRCEDHSNLELKHNEILAIITQNLIKNKDRLITMYKLICHTRDIISGKGEQKLALMQILGFYNNGLQNLAFKAIKHFVIRNDGDHPFGSWKDIKYFCNYVKEKTGDKNHPLINYALTNIVLNKLNEDDSTYNKIISEEQSVGLSETKESGVINGGIRPSLLSKWFPREKSKQFGWIFNKMADYYRPHYLSTALTNKKRTKAIIKCRIELKKTLTKINKYLNTTQILQCSGNWNEIDFKKVTSVTMRKQTNAFCYKDKKGNMRGSNPDRLGCFNNYKSFIEKAKSGSPDHVVKGKRVNVYELVKDAYGVIGTPGSSPEKKDTINLQWENNRENNKGLGNIIPCSDTSWSMTCDDNIPLYNSIGLGIRVSEITHPAFRDRVLTFARTPVWHNLSDCDTFIEKVNVLKNMSTGLNTDFYKALQMVLDVIVENDIPPGDVENIIVAVFSDMQIDIAIHKSKEYDIASEGLGIEAGGKIGYMDTMFECIKKMYASAGLKSKYKKPYSPPHLLFWNLRNTNGFPVLSTEKNVSMISGYNSAMLNVFCEKGMDALKEFTPRTILAEILNNKRYDILNEDVNKHIDARNQIIYNLY